MLGECLDDSCDSVTLIKMDDIARGKRGYAIKCPGKYKLAENIIIHNKRTCMKAAIIIESTSNVILDLGYHTISSPSNIIAIYVNNAKSISIINGPANGMRKAGIQINNSSDIKLSNISITNTGTVDSNGGLQINDSTDIKIDKIRCLFNYGSGMYLHGVIKAYISNSNFDDNIGGNVAPQFFPSGGVGGGVYVDGSEKTTTSAITFIDCTFNRNTGGGEGVGMEVGPFSFLPITDVKIIGCQFLENQMTGVDTEFNDASGLVLLYVTDFLIKDCIANGQLHPTIAGPLSRVITSGATGFSINASTNGIIENCQADNNSGKGRTSIGIRTRGCSNVITKNCQFSGNINTEDGQAFGFYTDTDEVTAEFFPPVGSACVINSCTAQGNTSLNGLSGGFKIADLVNSTIKDCISQQNAHGILVTGTNTQTTNNIFNNNTLQGNILTGIRDEVENSRNLYINNTAINNGVNYEGLPPGTPITILNLETGFVNPPVQFSNLDVLY